MEGIKASNQCAWLLYLGIYEKIPKKATYKSNFIDIFAQVVYFSR